MSNLEPNIIGEHEKYTLTSIAVSLKRIADALDKLAADANQVLMTKIADEAAKHAGAPSTENAAMRSVIARMIEEKDE